jgi:TetR/AcrR family transcriptional repressor for divergent bdcA
VLEEAARYYAADPGAAGCLVLEGVRCTVPEAREAAGAYNLAAERVIHNYIAARYPQEAERLTDFVSTTMSGLSARFRVTPLAQAAKFAIWLHFILCMCL